MTQKLRTRKPPAHNQQYERNERAIQNAIRKLLKTYRERITARHVAKAAGLTRQTVYNHHPNINRAISENEHSLLTEFSITLDGQAERLRKIIKNNANGRLFFLCWFSLPSTRRPLARSARTSIIRDCYTAWWRWFTSDWRWAGSQKVRPLLRLAVSGRVCLYGWQWRL